MAKMKYWNGTTWKILDAKDADTVDGKHFIDIQNDAQTKADKAEQNAKSYTDEQITLVTETGIPKLNVYEYKFPNLPAGTTEIEIPLETFDKSTDTVKLYINSVYRDSDFYTVSADKRIILNEALSRESKATVEIWKHIPIGEDGSVSGAVIAIDTLPQNRVQGLTTALSDIETNVGNVETEIAALNDRLGTNENNLTTHLADYTLQVPYAVATGTANSYSVTLNPAPTSLVNGLAVAVKIPVDSTGTSTLNVNGLGAKTIKKANGANVTNLKAGGIYTLRYDGVNFILQGEGASGNATASDLLSGKTATTDAGEIVGSMPNRGAINETITTQNGQIIIPAGYHNGSGIVKATLPSKGAQTYIPGTTDQIISAGKYLAGNQTIKGDANLIPANIVSGKSIFNVAGSAITGGAKVKAVQTIVSSISKGTTTKTHTISAVNVTKSVIMLTAAYTNKDSYTIPAHDSLCASLSNSTTLKIERTASSNPVEYVAYVIEFVTGVTIQQGLSIPNYESSRFYIPINSVNTSRSIMLCSFKSGYSYSGDARGYCTFGYDGVLEQWCINVSRVLGISSGNYTNFLFSWYIITFD